MQFIQIKCVCKISFMILQFEFYIRWGQRQSLSSRFISNIFNSIYSSWNLLPWQISTMVLKISMVVHSYHWFDLLCYLHPTVFQGMATESCGNSSLAGTNSDHSISIYHHLPNRQWEVFHFCRKVSYYMWSSYEKCEWITWNLIIIIKKF